MLRSALAALAVLAGAAVTAGGAAANPTPPNGEGTAGPPYDYTTELVGQFEVVPLPDQAMLTRTQHGYRYQAGQQNTHLVVTLTKDGLRLADTGTERFKELTAACQEQKVEVGVAAVCRVPTDISTDQPLLLEVWPRLGHDFVDGSSLPATFAMTMLGDAGNDVALLSAGPDFFNGFKGRDRVEGGDGNDWIRSGLGRDVVWGGSGDDQIVGVEGDDTFYGGEGDDRLGGGPGGDRLYGESGSDFLLCDDGTDTAWTDANDRRPLACENVNYG